SVGTLCAHRYPLHLAQPFNIFHGVQIQTRRAPPRRRWSVGWISLPIRIALPAHANPAGGRGISAFSPSFFPGRRVSWGRRGETALAAMCTDKQSKRMEDEAR